jgi:hypothetical protein
MPLNEQEDGHERVINTLKYSGNYVKHSVTLHFADIVHLCSMYDFQNKQLLFTLTALTTRSSQRVVFSLS